MSNKKCKIPKRTKQIRDIDKLRLDIIREEDKNALNKLITRLIVQDTFILFLFSLPFLPICFAGYNYISTSISIVDLARESTIVDFGFWFIILVCFSIPIYFLIYKLKSLLNLIFHKPKKAQYGVLRNKYIKEHREDGHYLPTVTYHCSVYLPDTKNTISDIHLLKTNYCDYNPHHNVLVVSFDNHNMYCVKAESSQYISERSDHFEE